MLLSWTIFVEDIVLRTWRLRAAALFQPHTSAGQPAMTNSLGVLLLTSCRIPCIVHLFQQQHVLKPYSAVELMQMAM
jgi:hypothetical protein